jgi:uncharacterized Zn finger protein (UPF0148 family)
MTESTLSAVCLGTMITQLVAPLVLGIPALVRMGKKDDKRAAAEKGDAKDAAPNAAHAPAVAPLHCPSCGAPVPLEAAAFACPFCHAAINPPEDYQRLLALRARSKQELARAERLWRFSRVLTSRPVVWLFRVGVIVWALLVLFASAALSQDWPGMVILFAIVMVTLEVIVGLAFAGAVNDMRKMLPRLPAHAAMHIGAGNGTCPECGAPVRFDDGRLATTCGYCGADAYRAALAEAARADAQDEERRSRKSLREAVTDVRARREDFVVFFGFLAFAELFYAAVFLLMAGWDFIFG